MFLKAAASIILSASFLFGAVPSFPVIQGKAYFEAASFDAYVIWLADGDYLSMSVGDRWLLFDTDSDKEFTITLYKASSSRKIKSFTGSGSEFEFEVASLLDEDELYYVFISYEAFGMTITSGDH
ncbi:MAG: hypothetical protein IKS75_01885, partial [Clostridiales bacterium]|nr:hypothetical protein [Clostridiales bacterium]